MSSTQRDGLSQGGVNPSFKAVHLVHSDPHKTNSKSIKAEPSVPPAVSLRTFQSARPEASVTSDCTLREAIKQRCEHVDMGPLGAPENDHIRHRVLKVPRTQNPRRSRQGHGS